MAKRNMDRAALLAAGWRQIGDGWCPPWQSPYSYTFAAAQLEQAQKARRQPKAKRILKSEAKP